MKLGTDAGSRLGLLGAAAALALAFSGAASRPALALDPDGKENIFSSMIELVMPSEKETPTIEYHERAPLVVPKDRQSLPPPQPKAAERSKAWPKDQEIARREAARAAAARPRVDEVWNPPSRAELDRVRGGAAPQGAPVDTSCNDPLGRVCNQASLWSSLKTKSKEEDVKQLVPGQEASREFLTDPPPGYRKPTTVQKYTFEVKKDDDNLADARAQAIEERRRHEDR